MLGWLHWHGGLLRECLLLLLLTWGMSTKGAHEVAAGMLPEKLSPLACALFSYVSAAVLL